MTRKPADQALRMEIKRFTTLCERVPLCKMYLWSTKNMRISWQNKL